MSTIALTEITPKLFLGNKSSPSVFLKKYPCSGILSLCKTKCLNDVVKGCAHYKFIDIKDEPTENILDHFDELFQYIDKVLDQNLKVLIHCKGGFSRSATVVIAYLMHSQNLSLKTAHDIVKEKRPIIRPNIGFWKQLISFEKDMHGSNSVIIVRVHDTEVPSLYATEIENMI